jgi:hypothetical protein
VPLLVTASGVLGGVPLEDGSPLLPPGTPPAPVVFDAVTAWAGFSPLNATAFAYAAWGNATTTLAKMNPGYDVAGHSLDPTPPLTGAADLSLADYIVSHRLFNFYLVSGCIPGTDEHTLVEAMSAGRNPWPRPIAVWGYDDTAPIGGGDTFEAETLCVSRRNMGQVATSGVSNLAFLSRAPPLTAPLVQVPAPAIPFNASRTYVSFIVGDGDNIAYLKSSRFDWLQQRAAECAAPAGCGYPLGWSISPHLLQVAPDMLRWYAAAAAATAHDYLVLPPSGHLYAYPTLMRPADQAAFVAATEADAAMLNTSTTVAWEFMGTWGAAIAEYVPRYAPVGQVRALVAVNVPFFVPVIDFGPDEFFKVINGSVVLFRPNEWRGTTGGIFLQNATTFAADINAYPPGTVTAIYMTSDGGAQLSDFTALAALLGEHVVVVPPPNVADLAVASHAAREAARARVGAERGLGGGAAA